MTTIAIVSALPEEQKVLLGQLQQVKQSLRGGRTFWSGQWGEQQVVLALSGIGKVAAATATTTLIEAFGIDRLLFTGVAAGIGDGVKVGDVVVADSFIQHDINVSPLYARYEIPLYGRATIDCDARTTSLLLQAVHLGLSRVGDHFHRANLLAVPTVHRGLVATGDQFIGNSTDAKRIRNSLQNAGFEPLALEMEGAAVAQVCFDYGIPFAALRTISDRADADAHLDFSAFIQEVAGPYALAMISQFMRALPK